MIESTPAPAHATLLDLIKAVDPYPYPSSPLKHPRDGSRMTPFHLVLTDFKLDPPILPVGHIHPVILADMLAYNISTLGKSFDFYPVPGPRADDVVIKAVKAVAFHFEAVEYGEAKLTQIIDALVEFMRSRGTIPEDKFGPNEERFSIYASPKSSYLEGRSLGLMENAVATVARSRSGFLGCAIFGVLAICYEGQSEHMRIWVQKRGKGLFVGAGLLDPTAAGALTAGMTPAEGIVQECVEEAALPAEFCASSIQFSSSLSYWMSHKDWVRPHNCFAFEMRLEDGQPRPSVPKQIPGAAEGPEVDSFQTMSPTELKRALLQGRFQPPVTYGLIEFLDRHGFLEDEPDMHEVRERSRREQGVAKPVGIEF